MPAPEEERGHCARRSLGPAGEKEGGRGARGGGGRGGLKGGGATKAAVPRRSATARGWAATLGRNLPRKGNPAARQANIFAGASNNESGRLTVGQIATGR